MNELKRILTLFFTPQVLLILLISFIVLYLKNRKTILLQEEIYGDRVNSCLEVTLSQFSFGVLGGVLGSLIFKFFNINFSSTFEVYILFVISLILMKIKRRYMCFSYSGAILGCYQIIINKLNFHYTYELSFEIKSLIIFVGVLHMVEGLLVMLDGDSNSVPIFKKNDNNQTVGGYKFNRYWIISALIISSVVNDFTYIPFCIVCGYSTKTFTKTKKEKTFQSGCIIFCYGILTIFVANLCKINYLGEIIALIIMIIMHECMLMIQNKIEEKNEFKFISDEDGIIVLDINKKCKLKELGIEIGSKILKINNERVRNEKDIYNILKNNLYHVTIESVNNSGKYIKFEYYHKKDSKLGIIVVPYDKKESFSEIFRKISV